MIGRRKTLFEYIILGVFIMCIGFAMSAALEFTTVARERQYLLQGKILLLTAGIAIALFILLRAYGRVRERLNIRSFRILEAVTFALLLLAAFLLRHQVISRIVLEPESDFETYYRLGSLLTQQRILSGEGLLFREYVAKFPHTLGYPMLVLAPVFKVFGIGVKAGLYANLLLSLGSIVLVHAIARKAMGRVCALLAMFLAAVWPSHVLYSSMLASEPAFTFMILVGMLLAVLLFDKGKKSMRERRPIMGVILVFALGVTLGIANAIRPMALILAIAVCMALLFNGERRPVSQGGARQILSKGWLCALIVFLVYSLTNMVITQTVYATVRLEPAGGLTASGYNLLVGTNVENKGVWNQEDADFFANVFNETGSASASHMACMEAALERMAANPEDTLDLYVYKFRDLWQSDDFGIDWNLLWAEQQGVLTPELSGFLEAIRPIGRQMYLCVLTFIMIGALRQWRNNAQIAPPYFVMMLFFLGTALLHMLLETQVRYHYNMIPFLILLGTYAVYGWQREFAEQGRDRIAQGEDSPAAAPEGAEEAPGDAAAPQPAFDMAEAIRSGSIKVVISQASATEAALASEARGKSGKPVRRKGSKRP